jgi:uncharacterized caspase-like protein
MTRPGLFRRWAALAALPLCLLVATAAAAADRVALLIGNNNYATSPLRNAVNDATDLGDVLKELGFTVIVRTNTSRKEMIDAIREFGTAMDGAKAALFFYAGHAMQFKDRNYLVPIDAAMGSQEDVTFFSVEVAQVFDRMEKARTQSNIIVLDACRDNPFAGTFQLTSAGLAQINAPSGTLIAYATSPGSVAADGFGRNGIYTKNILQNIKAPDLPVEIMFKRVREGVERETRKSQTPWDSSSLKGDFAFNSTSAARTQTSSAPASGPSADAALSIEREFWSSVKDSTRPEDIRAYLDKYPNGNFVVLATNRLDALQRPTRVAAAPAIPAPPPAAATPASAAPVRQVTPTPAPAEKPPAPAAPAEGGTALAPVHIAAAAPTAAVAKAAAPPPAAQAVVPPPAPVERSVGREIAPGIREVIFADGTTYVGHFAADRPDGKGKFTFANGDTYEGDVKAGVIVGRGTYVSPNGDVFEGTFEAGKPQGVGIYRFAKGDRYEGEVAAGNMQGKGRYFSSNGDRVEASFVNGKAQGKGVYFFANKDRYEGDIQAGVLSGQGAYFFSTGLKYEGEIVAGRPMGKGVFWFLDGSRFEGVFEDGIVKAKGELIKTDGTRAAAEIVNGNARLLN